MQPPVPPAIVPVPASGQRPRISVMIPVYKPGPYLTETLRSILAQDPGPDQMQITVVDDASPGVDVPALLRQSDGSGRVGFERNTANLGLAGNWNRAIELARGEYVHLLHQDDLVSPGFYARLLDGLTRSTAGMAFCRHAFVDDTGTATGRSRRERWRAGLLDAWLARISQRQLIQCPAAIVRRSVYEAVGGFRPDLNYALDWEMWVRIAAAFHVWYEPRILASYRRHRDSETTRLTAAGRIGTDVMRAIGIFSQHLPPAVRLRLTRRAYRRLVRSLLRDSARLLEEGTPAAARQQLDVARAALRQLPAGFTKSLAERRLARMESRSTRM